MALLQLRPKRQVTLPLEVTEQLNLQVGDYLEAHAEGDRIVLTVKEVRDRAQKYSIMDMVGAAPGVYRSEDEIDAAIAESREDRT